MHDLWLLSDEVYEDLAFARPHVGAWSLPEMAERTVVVSSLSKSHALPGFRLGWVVGPPALIRHLFNLLLSMTYGGPAFIQDGAVAALTGDLPDVAALREDYRTRAALMSERLRAAPGCRVVPPEGGMFVLLDVRGTGLTAGEFALRLLAAEGSRCCRATASGRAPPVICGSRCALPTQRLGRSRRADRALRAASGAVGLTALLPGLAAGSRFAKVSA